MTSNLKAAKSGDRKLALEVLRDTLAEKLDTTDKEIHAQLAPQYRATLAELAEFEEAPEESDAEGIAKRAATLRLA